MPRFDRSMRSHQHARSGSESSLVETNLRATTMLYCDAIMAARTPSHVGTTMRVATESSALCVPAFPRSVLGSCRSRKLEQPARYSHRRLAARRHVSESRQMRRTIAASSAPAGEPGNGKCVLQHALICTLYTRRDLTNQSASVHADTIHVRRTACRRRGKGEANSRSYAQRVSLHGRKCYVSHTRVSN